MLRRCATPLLFGVSHSESESHTEVAIGLPNMYHTPVTKQGLGHPMYDITLSQLRSFALGGFIEAVCWTFIIWTVKISILAFYWRLFSANRRSIRLIIWILAAVVMAWGIAVVGARPSSQRSLSAGRCWWISDDKIVTSHSISMCSCQRIMEPYPERGLLLNQPWDLRGLGNTTCCHRCSASGLSSAFNLESTHAKVSEDLIDRRICVGRLACFPFPYVYLIKSSHALVLRVNFVLTTIQTQSDHYLRRPLEVHDQRVQKVI